LKRTIIDNKHQEKLTLSIIIPAYNEEDSIADIIRRCLNERENIVRETPVETVEIIVVNDGSRDRTAEIAAQFNEISLITFPLNRGYGAAIKEGFEQAHGELTSFLDADGTCDPNYFIDMCNTLIKHGADIVIGSRMSVGNKMPRTRRIGNLFFAGLINIIGGASITDSASGMRVIKKNSLQKIYPLPDGLHFTPAMSCRAVLDRNITILEVPMTYKERVGESKLSVLSDGIRFLKTIIDIALTYEPFRFFGIMGIVLFLTGFCYGIYPIYYYMMFKLVPDYMIYRLITVMVCIVSSFTLFSVGIISDEITNLIHDRSRKKRMFKTVLYEVLTQKKLIIFGAACALCGIAINYKTIWEYATTGMIHVHWVYIVTGAFFVLAGAQALALGILRRILTMLRLVKQAWDEKN